MDNAERKLWHKGPNYTADAVIINTTEQKILLIQREDTEQWALPGGFVDEDETPLQAVQREAFEETGLVITTSDKDLVYQGPVEDPRNSDTAWIETSGYLFRLTAELEATAGDDAKSAQWTPLDTLPELYGSHQQIVENALRSLDN
ncbi:NUDIX domain-containing protein [Candidatus Saccharibacteria bacterium TM7i]|nr:NUDIX domain-containing protein [Candidatus Saccharibacteria bacterium TM7i]